MYFTKKYSPSAKGSPIDIVACDDNTILRTVPNLSMAKSVLGVFNYRVMKKCLTYKTFISGTAFGQDVIVKIASKKSRLLLRNQLKESRLLRNQSKESRLLLQKKSKPLTPASSQNGTF